MDAVIVLFVPAVSATADEVAEAVERCRSRGGADKPVLAVVMSSEGSPRRCEGRGTSRRSPIRSPPPARSAAPPSARSGCAARRAPCPSSTASTAPRAEAVVERALETDDVWLEPGATRELLLAYGVPLVPERVADRRRGRRRGAGARLPGRGQDGRVRARTRRRLGGIALDLADEDAVREAGADRPAGRRPADDLQGAPSCSPGIVQDPVFGPLVAFGPGGVFAELIGEAPFRIAPLTDVDAEELVTSGKAGRLVAGFRGAPPADVRRPHGPRAAARTARRGLPAVAELDLNPVLALPDRCVAVDARVRVQRPEIAAARSPGRRLSVLLRTNAAAFDRHAPPSPR